jgi:hypothetical protein
MHEPVYALLLDLFPLTDEICRENAALGGAIQALALELALGKNNELFDGIAVLVRLAGDLGYTSQEVVRFLTRGIELARAGRSQ